MFIDYNQNARDRTVASAYSVRAVPDARVSCPLEWDEVADVEPAELRLETVPARLRERGDPSAAIDEQPGRLDGLLELAARDEREGLGDAPWPPHFRKQKGEPPACSRAGRERRRQRRVNLPLIAAASSRSSRSRARSCPTARTTSMRSSSTAFAASRSSTARRCSCSRATASRSGATSPSSHFPPGRYVLDGEIVVRDRDGREDFDALGQRIHPAASRVERLAARDARGLRRLRPARARGRVAAASGPSPSAARRSRACSRATAFAGAPVELMRRATAAQAPALARARRGGDRQGALRALPPGRAQGDGEGQARAHDRRGRGRLAPRQGAGHRRRADPRPLRWRPSCASSDTAPASPPPRSAGWSSFLAPYRDRRARLGGPQPLERGQGSRVGRAAPGAGRGDRLRPRLRRTHPPRRQAAALARGQGRRASARSTSCRRERCRAVV